jgi:hypothetical protein
VGAGPFRIVGVIADIHQAPLGQAGEPVIYHTLRQFPYRPMTLVARGADAAAVTAAMRTALRGLDPTLPLSNVKTLDERFRTRTAAPRLLMSVLIAFAVLTGTLAAIGVYGLLACVVNDRRRDRHPAGARRAAGALARLVTKQGLGLAATGVILGLFVAQLARGLLQAVLFETQTTDVAAAAAAGGCCCWPPASRASRPLAARAHLPRGRPERRLIRPRRTSPSRRRSPTDPAGGRTAAGSPPRATQPPPNRWLPRLSPIRTRRREGPAERHKQQEVRGDVARLVLEAGMESTSRAPLGFAHDAVPAR